MAIPVARRARRAVHQHLAMAGLTTPAWVRELGARLELPPAEPGVSGDFGGGPFAPWRVAVQTRSIAEVQAVFDVASRHGVPVACRGAGHSSGGQTAAPGGIVLTHRPRGAALAWRAHSVEVPAHWAWSRVEQALVGSGRELCVTTSSMDTTVGGTLSVGGFGPRSVRYGPQVEQVEELWLVCVSGEVVRCSPERRPDLFFSALTGLGQVGLIDRVVLRTAQSRPWLASVGARHSGLVEMSEQLTDLVALGEPGPDYFCTLIKEGSLRTFRASAHVTRPEAEAALEQTRAAARLERRVLHRDEFERDDRHMPLDTWQSCRHLWADYCFDAAGFARFARFFDATLGASLLGHLGYVMCMPPRVGPAFALDMRPPSAGRVFSVGLFHSVPLGDTAALDAARAAHERALACCLDCGGRPYLYGFWGGRAGLPRALLERCFGEGHTRLRAARAQLDPAGILNPHALA